MKENRQLRWAVLGTGVTANEMTASLGSMGRTLDAVGNRTHSKAAAFAEKYGVKKVYGDFHEMFTDPDIDAVYITTPHNTHMAFLEQALSHGKHVFCEKSITLNTRELERAVKLAREHRVVLAETMTIYHMPLYRVLRETPWCTSWRTWRRRRAGRALEWHSRGNHSNLIIFCRTEKPRNIRVLLH